MSVFFEGNAFIDGGQIQDTNIINTTIGSSNIKTSSLDMMDLLGNLQNITNVKDPIEFQDAATKKYVDNVGFFKTITLTGTTPSNIKNYDNTDLLNGSYTIYVIPPTELHPSAIFNVTKNRKAGYPHVVRSSATPGLLVGVNSNIIVTNVLLKIHWEPNETIKLSKINDASGIFNENYRIKII